MTPENEKKFFFEGEEEMGSVNLEEILRKHQAKLGGDLWIIADGPRHASGRKVVQFGVRGDVNMDLTVYAAKRPLHSGNYGNWEPNPALRLVKLLASMKDDTGRVTVAGFYDDVTPLTPTELTAIDEMPNVEAALKKDFLVAQPERPEQRH